MITIKNDLTYKGTRILIGNQKRNMIDTMVNTLQIQGYSEIIMPVVQFQSTFKNKVGEENNNLMFNFKDRGDRDICLAPEYTAVVQNLARTYFRDKRNVKLFYVQECFRGENPQAGRWRQFTQLGVEILNPTEYFNEEMLELATVLLIGAGVTGFEYNKDAIRGLDYYKSGKGFEISHDELGSAKQICGGGEYDGGIGFAIGIDRLLMLKNL